MTIILGFIFIIIIWWLRSTAIRLHKEGEYIEEGLFHVYVILALFVNVLYTLNSVDLGSFANFATDLLIVGLTIMIATAYRYDKLNEIQNSNSVLNIASILSIVGTIVIVFLIDMEIFTNSIKQLEN